jgi:hypothetical protein
LCAIAVKFFKLSTDYQGKMPDWLYFCKNNIFKYLHMKTKLTSLVRAITLLTCIIAFIFPFNAEAQRGGQRGGGGKDRSAVSKPAGNADRSANKGGQRPSTGNTPAAKPSGDNRNKEPHGTGAKSDNPRDNKAGGQNVSTGDRSNIQTGNRNNVSTGNKTNVSGNNVNINNSRTVNRNTVVVANPRPYPRPPYAYGGHSYYAYHPYHYHPYQPYHYGPMWHPWGFFITTLAVTAVVVTVANQQYHYDQGVYYTSANGGYTVVQAPVGAVVTTIPPGSQTVVINETTNNYYYGGTYYEKKPDGYVVVPPTAGSVVENLPEGGKEVKLGEVTYVQVGDTYYQPIEKDGKSVYEVVDVKSE